MRLQATQLRPAEKGIKAAVSEAARHGDFKGFNAICKGLTGGNGKSWDHRGNNRDVMFFPKQCDHTEGFLR